MASAVIDELTNNPAALPRHATGDPCPNEAASPAPLPLLERLRLLPQAILTINAATTLEELLRTAGEQSRRILDAHQCVISLAPDLNWGQAATWVSVSQKYADAAARRLKLDPSSLYALICGVREPLRLTQEQLEAHPAWRDFDKAAAEHLPLRGWLAARLIGPSGRDIGFIQLSDRQEGEFSSDDELLLQQLSAGIVAAADALVKLALARKTAAEYQALFDLIDEAVWEADAVSGQITFISRRIESLLGYPPERWMQEPTFWSSIIHPQDRERSVAALTSATTAGRETAFEFRAVAADGRLLWLRQTLRPVRDAAGALLAVRGTIGNITERVRVDEERGNLLMRETRARAAADAAGRRSRFLAEAGAILAGSLEYESTLAAVARLAVPTIADWCFVEALSDQASMRQIAIAHADPEKVRFAEELARKYPRRADASAGLSEVLRTGKSSIWPEVPDSLLSAVAADPEHLRLLRSMGLRSTMIIPMIARQRVLGAITLLSAESGRLFDADDLSLAEELARRAAAAVDAALLYRDAREKEQSLRESEARFRQLADAMPQIIWVTRPDGYHEYFNRRWYEYVGLDFEQTKGHQWADPLHPDDRERSRERWSHALATGEPYEIEYRFRRYDGQYRWFLARALPVRDESGGIIKWFGACTDIHDKRQAEEALRWSELRYRSLIEATAAIVWDTPASGEFECPQPGWSAFTGQSFEELRGWGWINAVHPDDRQETARVWLHALEKKILYQVEHRLRRHDREFRHMLVRAVPIIDDGGVIREWIGIHTDITERKRMEQALLESQRMLREINEQLEHRVQQRTAELQAANARLEASNRELQDFASVASHDLQEPLRKIQAFGDRLHAKAYDQLGEDGRDYLDRMKSAASRMALLISDLLAFARVTTKAQPFQNVQLWEITAEVLSDIETRIEQTRARVTLLPLPQIEADPLQMRQLLQNLLSNALKFQKPGVAPDIRISSKPAPDRPGFVNVIVEDNGIGFDPKYLDRIFNVFQRLHGRGRYEGTGIGLAVCRKIAERHGGAITATSVPGEGATFVVTLPVRQPIGETTNAG